MGAYCLREWVRRSLGPSLQEHLSACGETRYHQLSAQTAQQAGARVSANLESANADLEGAVALRSYQPVAPGSPDPGLPTIWDALARTRGPGDAPIDQRAANQRVRGADPAPG